MKREGPRTLCCRNPLVFNKVSTSSQKGTDNVEMAPLLTTLQKRKISPSTKIG